MSKAVILMAMFAVFVLLVGSYYNLPGSFRFYWVQSGSMEPAIKTGSLIVLQQNASYAVGDIITFKSESERNENNPKRTTTHRILSETSKDGQIQYQTKGDANDIADIDPVESGLVIGKVITHAPCLGHIPAFARTQEGLLILIVIPSTIIVYHELQNIKKEITKMIAAKKSHAQTDN
jgi:signal peptidase I